MEYSNTLKGEESETFSDLNFFAELQSVHEFGRVWKVNQYGESPDSDVRNFSEILVNT